MRPTQTPFFCGAVYQRKARRMQGGKHDQIAVLQMRRVT
jgi:hypothetical protein